MIRCCDGCLPPKRHSRCHSTCPEYIREKAKHEEDNAKIYSIKEVERGLDEQYLRSSYKTLKKKRRK